MKNYIDYQLEDFLEDQSFREWVRAGGKDQPATQWHLWLSQHAEQAAIAATAQEILLATGVKEQALPAQYKERIIENTLQSVQELAPHRNVFGRNWHFPLSIAASIVLLIMALWQFNIGPFGKQDPTPWTIIANKGEGATIKPIALSDGSTVLLYPGSSLHLPPTFASKQRVVHLEGKAFFEIQKDASRPFYVHSQEMVTKVLGTSFLIEAFETDPRFEVVVKSGKVTVSTVEKDSKKQQEIELSPNHQLVLERDRHTMVKKVITTEEVQRVSPNNIQKLIFEDSSVASILQVLEKRYDVKIVLKGASLADCALTTTFNDEPLFEKLKIICQAIGPSTDFKVLENQILITTKGCNN
ncbi:ferric-dicitrate binding protein FerR (iron transport regulator) [Dyadobacter jejuensis]|uniref:Ferric-dicitrate binding protein FerR (Iron transport regulator) n=1 Tax=Dyadobacter jejuensis TaxID=1082580 RepID=A0A316AN36_9BACT|nr:FecR family protein [Dyadobacter jejuensis]PWJ59175.1 ferric-dicitrate binding protein FerR (iron transport regulator) [Dyadobacter jejuensis]